MTIRVLQWATGNVGRNAVEGVLSHPDLELVGAFVYSPDKVGRDVGELCGTGPVGVVAVVWVARELVAQEPLPAELRRSLTASSGHRGDSLVDGERAHRGQVERPARAQVIEGPRGERWQRRRQRERIGDWADLEVERHVLLHEAPEVNGRRVVSGRSAQRQDAVPIHGLDAGREPGRDRREHSRQKEHRRVVCDDAASAPRQSLDEAAPFARCALDVVQIGHR